MYFCMHILTDALSCGLVGLIDNTLLAYVMGICGLQTPNISKQVPIELFNPKCIITS